MTNAQKKRHAILASCDLLKSPIEVPEWGAAGSGLYLKTMTILEGIEFEDAKEKIEDAKFVALYVAYVLCDEEGDRIFDPSGDVEVLCGRHPKVLMRIFNAGLALNNGSSADGATPPGE